TVEDARAEMRKRAVDGGEERGRGAEHESEAASGGADYAAGDGGIDEGSGRVRFNEEAAGREGGSNVDGGRVDKEFMSRGGREGGGADGSKDGFYVRGLGEHGNDCILFCGQQGSDMMSENAKSLLRLYAVQL